VISKTVRIYKRTAYSWQGSRRRISDDKHTEKVVKETWWLLWCIPLYSRENTITSNI
jgi:hypothetical protein